MTEPRFDSSPMAAANASANLVIRALLALARSQVRHPWRFVVGAFVLTALAMPFVLRLGLNGDFTALLPAHSPAVRDMHLIVDRFGTASTLSIAIQAPSDGDVDRVTRAVGQALEGSKPAHVTAVDWGVAGFEEFVREHKHVYADLATLTRVRDDFHARVEKEIRESSPLYVDLEDESEKAAPPTIEEIRKRLEGEVERGESELSRFPGGLFKHRDQPLTIIFVRTDVAAGELEQANALVASVRGTVDRVVAADAAAAGIRVDYGGDLMDMIAETEQLTAQMIIATLITIVLVMTVVFVFFRAKRSILVIGLALTPPLLVTFGIAQLTVSYLNTSTAFLMSIVIGNGINPNIIWLARYFEKRRSGLPVDEALADAHVGTWVGTLVASLAAGLSYASLIVTDFRGFRDFGIIGGVGMVLCWLAAFLLLPAASVIADRLRPIRASKSAAGNFYGRLFAWLTLRAPRTIIAVAAVLTVAATALVVRAVAADPIEYDFRKLTSKRPEGSRIKWVNDRQGEIVDESLTGSALVLLTEERDQVPEVVRQIEAHGAANPGSVGPVRSIDGLLPTAQAEKGPVLADLRADMIRARKFATDEEKVELDEHLPPEVFRPVTTTDLPEPAARLFTERDGTRGRLVFVEHHEDANSWDGKYLLRWAAAARSVVLEPGGRPPVTGQAVVFADLLASILRDGPKALAVASAVTVLLLLFSFRKTLDRLLTLGTVVVGILWMAALMALVQLKLNFLNFVAFPITFGNGADYGVNVISRFDLERERWDDRVEAVRQSVERTGGAVVLNSMTTVIGYITLYTSTNQALNSFGVAMAISEVTCVAAAVLVMPAILVVIEQGRAKRRAAAAQARLTTPAD